MEQMTTNKLNLNQEFYDMMIKRAHHERSKVAHSLFARLFSPKRKTELSQF